MTSGTGGVWVDGCGGAHSSAKSRAPVPVPPPTWPRVDVLEFGPLPTAIASARAHARAVLAEWGLGHLIDDAVVVVSELMTNAYKASRTLSPPTPMVLRLLANEQQLLIEAWDQWVEGYELQQGSPDAEHGRGLTVVTALSDRWGVGHIGELYKMVWAEFLIQQPSSRTGSSHRLGGDGRQRSQSPQAPAGQGDVRSPVLRVDHPSRSQS